MTRLRTAALTAALSLSFPALAQADEHAPAVPLKDFKIGALTERTVALADATQRDCRTRYPAGTPGVAHETFTAASNGSLLVRTPADHRDHSTDVDLVVFDTADRMRAGSLSFSASEVVDAGVRPGETLIAQLCLLKGAATDVKLTQQLVSFELAGPLPKQSLVRVKVRNAAQIRQLEMAGLDLGHDNRVASNGTGGYASVFLHSAADRKLLAETKLPFSVVVDDLAANDARVLATPAQRSNLPSGRDNYRKYEDFAPELKKLVADFPDMVRPITLPKKSFQGRAVEGVQIAKNIAAEDGRPTFFLMGLHHAREWPAAEAPLEFAQLLTKSKSDPRIAKLLDTVRVTVVPMINPDGYVESRTSPLPDPDPNGQQAGGLSNLPAGLAGLGAYRRKNCAGQFPAAAPCSSQHGVDPNRNYGALWGGPGASTSPEQQDYRGTGQWSETETQNVHEFSQKNNVTTLITTHNVAALVLRSPGIKTQGLAPDEPALKAVGDAMAKATGYVSQYGWQLYDTTGTTEDWNYAAAGTFGYTIEMGPTNGEFHHDYQIGLIDEWNGIGKFKGKGLKEAYLLTAEAAADRTQHSTLQGRAPAGRTLRVKKTFKTLSSPVCTANNTILPRQIGATGGDNGQPIGQAVGCAAAGPVREAPDGLEYTMTVPASGKYDWIITPSSRPFELRAGKAEKWTLTCEDGGQVKETKEILIGRGETAVNDLPCGGELVAPTTPAGLKDKLAPQSKFLRGTLKATRSGMRIRGTSKDLAPKGLVPQLGRVTVALGRRIGSQCQFVTASGKLGPKVSCLRTKYLPAAGTSQWTFVFKKSLRPGKYLAWVRGVDKAGNTERKNKKRNLITFNVR